MKNKIISLIKNNKKWIISFICILIFIAILEDIFDNEIINFDTLIFNNIKMIRTEKMTRLFKVITAFGSATILIIITMISFIVIKNKKIGITMFLNLATIGAMNQILKHIIQRPRPIESRLIEEKGYSFPSGHSMASVAFYGLIIFFVFKYVKNKKIRNLYCILLNILVLLIGVSRIYLGVHYASDVLAGFFLSIAYLTVFITTITGTMYLENNNK